MNEKAFVKSLFLKIESGAPMKPVTELVSVTQRGIEGDQAFGRSTRQVLLVDQSVLAEFGLKPGDLRENITVEGIDLHGLAPGACIDIGAVRLRVNGGCSPCSKLDVLQSGLQDAIQGKRGILASVVHGGLISIGDPVIKAVDA